jgi:hypothetical protein
MIFGRPSGRCYTAPRTRMPVVPTGGWLPRTRLDDPAKLNSAGTVALNWHPYAEAAELNREEQWTLSRWC